MGVIYCVTNTVNGKKYVGKTVQNLEDRWDVPAYATRIDERFTFTDPRCE